MIILSKKTCANLSSGLFTYRWLPMVWKTWQLTGERSLIRFQTLGVERKFGPLRSKASSGFLPKHRAFCSLTDGPCKTFAAASVSAGWATREPIRRGKGCCVGETPSSPPVREYQKTNREVPVARHRSAETWLARPWAVLAYKRTAGGFETDPLKESPGHSWRITGTKATSCPVMGLGASDGKVLPDGLEKREARLKLRHSLSRHNPVMGLLCPLGLNSATNPSFRKKGDRR